MPRINKNSATSWIQPRDYVSRTLTITPQTHQRTDAMKFPMLQIVIIAKSETK